MAQFEAARRGAEGGLYAPSHRRRATLDPTNDPSFFSPLSQGKAAEELAVSSVPKAVYRDAAGPLGIGVGGAPQASRPPRRMSSAGGLPPSQSPSQPVVAAPHTVPPTRVVPAAAPPVQPGQQQRTTMDEAEYLRSMAAAALAAVPLAPVRAAKAGPPPQPPQPPAPPSKPPPVPTLATKQPAAGAPKAAPAARPQPPTQAEILAAAQALRPVAQRQEPPAAAPPHSQPDVMPGQPPAPPVELTDVRRTVLASLASKGAPARVEAAPAVRGNPSQALTVGMQARRAALGSNDSDDEWDD